MNPRKILNQKRQRRTRRTRAKILGLPQKPRLAVFRSNRMIYAQLINDQTGETLIQASSLELKAGEKKKTKTEQAKLVGGLLAERASTYGIKSVTFDRRRYRYHGRIAALAETLRQKNIKF